MEDNVSYVSPTYIPKRKQQWWKSALGNLEHQGAIYANNLIANQRVLEQMNKFQSTPEIAPRQEHTVTSPYLQTQQAMQQIAEQRRAFEQQVQNTSNLDAAMKARIDFESKVISPQLNAINQYNAQHLQQEQDKATAVANFNNKAAIETANQNSAQSDAVNNYRNDQIAKTIAKNAAETSDYLNKAQASYTQAKLVDQQNRQNYNQRVSAILLENGKQQLMVKYERSFAEGLNQACSKYGGAQAILGVVREELAAGHITGLPAELQNALNDASLSAEETVDLIVKLSQNPSVQEATNDRLTTTGGNDGQPLLPILASELGQIKIRAEKQHEKDLTALNQQYQISLLSQDSILGEYSGAGQPMSGYYVSNFKKGGKTPDRWKQFLDYKAKQDKQTYTAVENESKRLDKNLKLQLDALDRETLILLRSIFK